MAKTVENLENSNQIGTVLTNAPEIYKGSYDEKVDIWSLGFIIYRLVFGKYPF